MDRNIGKKLDGRYEITELIGIGGMADVYKAVDIIEDKIVAVKILKNEFADDEEFLRRFRNESKAIAVLSHPNIVKIYDVGFTEKIQFIVMEYIDGITLKEFIEQQGVLKWKDAVHFVIQILRALQHAHDRGIVHRDIKPQNIMLFPDGTIKVMDFGIARFAREEGKTLSDKTIGSVHYISPEQARGDITDEKSDIYSVGVMLYEMLTGQKPFDGDNPVSVALMHMQSPMKMPREINNTIPEGLEEIVVRAMQKDASKRYQSASAMIRDIEEFKKNPSIVFEYKYMDNSNDGDTKYFTPVGTKKSENVVNVQNKKRKPAMPKDYEEYEEDDDEDDDDESKPSFLVPVLTAIAAAVLIIAAFFITIVVMDKLSEQNAEFDMPQLIGMNYNDAKAEYGDQLDIQLQETDYSELDKDLIFEQSRDAGIRVKKGVTIQVKVSKGVRMVTVPDVYGLNITKAKETIKNSGLEVEIQNRVDNDVTKDFVIETYPTKSESVLPGTVVVLYVSLGPELQDVIVPDVVGKTQEEAEKALKAKKLVPVIEQVDAPDEKGTVVSQSITNPTVVSPDTEIVLQISTGTTPVKEWRLAVPVTQGSRGSFDFNAYINGELIGTATKDNVAYADFVEINIKGTDVQTVVVEIYNKETKEYAELAKYSFDFSSGTATELSYDNYAFGKTEEDYNE